MYSKLVLEVSKKLSRCPAVPEKMAARRDETADSLQVADLLDEAICGDAELTFDAARKFVAANVSAIPDPIKLQLYGLYKATTEGKCSTKKPGMLDFKGRAKWDVWNALGDIDSEEAMIRYADVLESAVPDWEEQATGHKKGGEGMGGPVVSSLAGEEMPDPETLHDWATQGDTEKVAAMLATADVNARDESGCTPLHFAADRGSKEMVALLIAHGADINAVDEDGSTALHYAALCENEEMCTELVSLGIDVSIQDASGQTAKQIAPQDWSCW